MTERKEHGETKEGQVENEQERERERVNGWSERENICFSVAQLGVSVIGI